MNFKDQVDIDIDNVFFSNDEFAEIHCLDSTNLAAILIRKNNPAHQHNRTDAFDVELVEYRLSLVYKTKDYPYKLANSTDIILDNTPFVVLKWSESQGVATLDLGGITG